MSEIQNFTLKDVVQWVGSHEVEKGKRYIEAVSELKSVKNSIVARVQGTEKAPYHVQITFNTAGTKPLHIRCSCPVSHRCKHTAATLLKMLEAEDSPDKINPNVLTWLDKLVTYTKETTEKKTKATKKNSVKIFYVLKKIANTSKVQVEFFKATVDKENVIVSRKEVWDNVERAIAAPPSFVDDTDLNILRQLHVNSQRRKTSEKRYLLEGQQGDKIIRQIVATGRFYIEGEYDFEALKSGAIRPGHLEWKNVSKDRVKPVVSTNPESTFIIPCEPCWYYDQKTHELGQVEIDIPGKMLAVLFETPSLNEKELMAVSGVLHKTIPVLPRPQKITAETTAPRIVDEKLQPILILDSVPSRRGYYNYGVDILDFALVQYQYGDVLLEIDHEGEFADCNNEIVQVKRKLEQEKKALKMLLSLDLEPLNSYYRDAFFVHHKTVFVSAQWEEEEQWKNFLTEYRAKLEALGWKIIVKPNFRFNYAEVEEWQIALTELESEPGWFDLSMGIVVSGETVHLAPLLSQLFKRDSRWKDAAKIKKIKETEQLFFQTPEGKKFNISAARLKPIAQTLVDLFDENFFGKISRYDAPRFAAFLDDRNRWQFKNAEQIIQLAERLSNTQKIAKIPQPKEFNITLRPYQLDGLAWLQYLRENQLSGILADDMGLGKTAQTLAHLQVEKEAGRLKAPTLIVLPTSLIFNWRNEAQRFAPSLSILILHGIQRKEKFTLIENSDVVLTTYPLLARDSAELAKHTYYYLILDEAQMVKNAKSNTAAAVRDIKAEHRLCITGTPLENHLGELWSQFDFLMPGFLQDQKTFSRVWRTPIEKQGDSLRKDILAKRIKPFILRRTKEEVAKELPPKTTIIRTVKLEQQQRDLYETVRSSMDKKVREAIAANGFKRSQIVLLDALLKLRQVCCDPRLLSLENAKKVQERAKLTLLMDMLEELLDEGRRILLFSQFTSMLALIEEELEKKNIPYLKLTGQTRNREKPIQEYQEGKVPLFLISLKSGGVGLNLTAADTVIHYDPWWNPAVENQATDRAHRLGQTKPIFVYKLIVEGSIEERILALQEKKALLASSVLSEDTGIDVKFGEEDLKALFAPLPD